MIIFKKAPDLSSYIRQQKEQRGSIGFVPTMGALHEGHLSLIRSSKEKTTITVCSIFVNPTQFNNKEDFEKYPITIEPDIELLIKSNCDVLFLPDVDEIYPKGYNPTPYELGSIETVLEGYYRPGHFQGVCQVMDRLMEIVNPDILFLGQKDYQQCMVVNKLIRLLHKESRIHLQIGATKREQNGLAMSSRNLRLSAEEREKSTSIYKALNYIKDNLHHIPVNQLKEQAKQLLQQQGFVVDYVEVCDAETLAPSEAVEEPLIALIAAYMGKVRLIDNLLLNTEKRVVSNQ